MINETVFTISQCAKAVQFPGGRNKFNNWLKDNKYLQKDGQPYQKYIDNKWFVYIIKRVPKTTIPLMIGVPLVTIDGLAGLRRVVRAKFPICPPCNEMK